MRKMQGLAVLFGGVLLVASVPQAKATATLSFQVDGGAVIQCADGDACDLNPAAGVVNVSQSLAGGFVVNITTGISKPIFAQPEMDLNSVDVQAGGGIHDLVIAFSDTDFSVPAPQLIGTFGGTLTFGAGSTVQADGYYNTTNPNVIGLADGTNLGTHSFTLGPFGPGAFSGTGTGPGPGSTTPYSLTQVLSIHTTTAGSFSGDFDINAVPEPASVALLGGILLATVNAIRRKVRHA